MYLLIVTVYFYLMENGKSDITIRHFSLLNKIPTSAMETKHFDKFHIF